MNFAVIHLFPIPNCMLSYLDVFNGLSSSKISFETQDFFSSRNMTVVNEMFCERRLRWIYILKGWVVLTKTSSELTPGFADVNGGETLTTQ